jgi:hypothetical protein
MRVGLRLLEVCMPSLHWNSVADKFTEHIAAPFTPSQPTSPCVWGPIGPPPKANESPTSQAPNATIGASNYFVQLQSLGQKLEEDREEGVRLE